jgi:hypothetical protein
LLDVFETDWTLADATSPATARSRAHALAGSADVRAASGERLSFSACPKGWLPDESRWDLARLGALLDAARAEVRLQVLTYSTHNRGKTSFTTLDDALRRAAARGVHVRLLVSHCGANMGSHARRSIEALAALPNTDVMVLTIPPWSGGEIPFARVAHAKYLLVDDRTAWVGTSNWEGDSFFKSRNVGIIIDGGVLARIFDDGWSSAYARAISPSSRTDGGLPADAAPP